MKTLLAIILLACASLHAQDQYSPKTSQIFDDYRNGMKMIADYEFGTVKCTNCSGNFITVPDLATLAKYFDAYGIAGTTVINKEWQIYRPFNNSNFVFGEHALNLTATIPPGGGLRVGGIDSAQIWTRAQYAPGKTGYTVYAFETEMKVPDSTGAWPANWLYAKQDGLPNVTDGSEIDNPEFFEGNGALTSSDWTGYTHGPTQGAMIMDKRIGGAWHPGINFASLYHGYQTIWTPGTVFKYLSHELITAQNFKWTSRSAAQYGTNLAVGNCTAGDPSCNQWFYFPPKSVDQFPMILSIRSIKIWAK